MLSFSVISAVFVAAAGWIATLAAINRSRLAPRVKRALAVLAWLPWILLALGAPALHGAIAPIDAIAIGTAVTAGILVPTLRALAVPPQ